MGRDLWIETAGRIIVALSLAFLAVGCLQWLLDGAPNDSAEDRRARQAHFRATHTVYLPAQLAPGECLTQDMPAPVEAIRVCMRADEDGGR